MAESPIKGIMGVTMEKIKEMVDVDTIVGKPITVDEKTIVIPISKVSFGFASGGSDLPTKAEKELFGGGTGAGVTINPIGFLVIINGEAKLLQVSMNAPSSNAVINMIPDVMDKVTELFGKSKKSEDFNKKED